MTRLQQRSQEEQDVIRLKAIGHFGPMIMQEALLKLCRACGAESLDRFEKSMIDRIDRSAGEDADFEDMKEFATEQLYACIREAKASPDMTQPLEKVEGRRTQGRSEETRTLEDQLQEGLEDSFPASDPPSVVSTAISGGARKLRGTDEVLRQQREKR